MACYPDDQDCSFGCFLKLWSKYNYAFFLFNSISIIKLNMDYTQKILFSHALFIIIHSTSNAGAEWLSKMC